MAPPKERKTTLEPPNTAPGALPEPPKNAPGASPDATCSPRGRREPSRASCRPPERAFRHLFGTISTSFGAVWEYFSSSFSTIAAGVWCWPVCLSCCWRFALCFSSRCFWCVLFGFLVRSFLVPHPAPKKTAKQRANARARMQRRSPDLGRRDSRRVYNFRSMLVSFVASV